MLRQAVAIERQTKRFILLRLECGHHLWRGWFAPGDFIGGISFTKRQRLRCPRCDALPPKA